MLFVASWFNLLRGQSIPPNGARYARTVRIRSIMGEQGNPAAVAALLRSFARALDAAPAEDLLAARISLP